MNSVCEIVTTADGSHTLVEDSLKQSFHSMYGAITESKKVFIESGLEVVATRIGQIQMLEMGFGTGLNALLTAIFAEKNQKQIQYTGVDNNRIMPDQAAKLNYPELLGSTREKEIFKALHVIPDGQFISLSPYFKARFIEKDFIQFQPEERYYHLIYFDAFSPEAQPEIWTTELFNKMFHALIPEGILVTYSSKGIVKQNLRACGFMLERLEGPPGKRHILRAIKPK